MNKEKLRLIRERAKEIQSLSSNERIRVLSQAIMLVVEELLQEV